MRCLLIGIALVVCAPLPGIGAVHGDEVRYVGGTLRGIAQDTEGRLDISGESGMVFTAKKSIAVVPYKGIASLEYGLKAGRRVATVLLSKKRKHYLTVTYYDEAGINQSAVFELAKGIVNPVVTRLETRSGRKLEFDSEKSKKQFRKETK